MMVIIALISGGGVSPAGRGLGQAAEMERSAHEKSPDRQTGRGRGLADLRILAVREPDRDRPRLRGHRRLRRPAAAGVFRTRFHFSLLSPPGLSSLHVIIGFPAGMSSGIPAGVPEFPK